MSNLQTQNPIALSLILEDQVYLLKNDVIEISSPIPEKTADLDLQKGEMPVTGAVEKIIIEIPEDPQPANPSYKYIGDNNQYVLILVNEENAEVLKNDDLGFLLKIISAKKWELKDVAILNITRNQLVNYDGLKKFFAFNKVIMFGIDPKTIQFTGIVANKITVFNDTPVLASWHLHQIKEDKNRKTKLWEELKAL